MSWVSWITPTVVVAIAIAALLRRRSDLRQQSHVLAERAKAKAQGSHQARLLHPKIDLQNCIGCGACVRACPEEGVLALAFGQAVVVHGARCIGHGRCADACPTGAIALTLGDIKDRKDLPAIDPQHEAVTVPGLFLAGEITGFSLVHTAVKHGALVANEVRKRVAAQPAVLAPAMALRRPGRVVVGAGGAEEEEVVESSAHSAAVLDLIIVGLGPAGLSCALAAKQHGLRFLCIEQAEAIGGTVAAYPRKKMVMTQPMDLPLHGKLDRLEYQKEELVELWSQLAHQHRLPVKTGVQVTGVTRDDDGVFAVETSFGIARSRHLCLAVGRRGSPQKLDVPGEGLPKVAYSLLDAESYRDRSILVVGGGDSAIEAALALAEQPGNVVTLSYRKPVFTRIKGRNQQRIDKAIEDQCIEVLFESGVVEIREDSVTLHCKERDGSEGTVERANDEVFVFAGGKPPFPLLEGAGVSFDPALRPPEEIEVDRGTGLLVALIATLLGCVGLLTVRIAGASYYDLPVVERDVSEWHAVLRPQGAFGLFTGLVAATLFLVNLLYLARRSPRFSRWLPGSLRGWMSVHVATGFFALLFACVHSAFHIRDAVAGHSLVVMAIVVTTGAIGRWFYSFVPKAQNGRQADLEDLGSRVAAIAGEWDEVGRGFGNRVRQDVEALVSAEHFGRNLVDRVFSLANGQLRLLRLLRRVRKQGVQEGVPEGELQRILVLARRAHRIALQLTHYEEVRGILSSWRWMHRWLALLLGILVVVHVFTAIRFGGVDFGVLQLLGGDR
ncbi:MAG: NAD(P)-binding domain-containing protein [Planctomycetota bacterium]